MKLKLNSEIISGLIFSIVAIIIWFLIPSQIITMETTDVTAQTVPKIAISGLFICSVLLLLQGIFTAPKKIIIITKETFKTEDFRKEIKAIIYALILIVYMFMITYLGFIIATLYLVISTLIFYKSKKWYYYLITICTVFLVYYIFAEILMVSLP